MKLPNRKNPRLKDFDYSSNNAYFVTICAKDKLPLFNNDMFNKNILACLLDEKQRTGVLIYVYCLMPDHLHLLLSPGYHGKSISSFIGGFKSKASRISWEFGIQGKLWQIRFHDHVVRKREDLKTIGEYILNNPVRKHIVSKWQ